MSIYELLNYDELLRRIGVAPGEVWHCGDNPDPLDPVQTASGGLCLSEDINVNGLLLNHRDDNGTLWLCTGVDGWWTLPPSEIPDVPKPYWDGSLLTTGRYLARTITISGVFVPPDKSLVWWNRDALLRVSSIVRGVGLILLCGNESPTNPPLLTGTDEDDHPIQYVNIFYDPPKMAIIQMADVPLIDTTKPDGTTQFSLVFKCMQPTKLSLYEQNATLPVDTGGITRQRLYKAFAIPAPTDPNTTEYIELTEITGSAESRTYSEVLAVNLDSLIPDEELTESVDPDMSAYETVVVRASVHNAGNYFSFPIFVFGTISGADNENTVTVHNVTTGESMSIQKNVPEGNQLVVDTGMRRVAIVNPGSSPDSWVWDDRAALSLTSQWISIAPGDNTLITSKDSAVTLPIAPKIYWRDAWIG